MAIGNSTRASKRRRTRNIIFFHQAGLSPETIARRVGTSPEQVARTLRKAGVLETDKLEQERKEST